MRQSTVRLKKRNDTAERSNAMLSEIRFSDSIYQIDILPTDDENRQFYEMLTAEELNMKCDRPETWKDS
ncbi:MAG: hypothetical protein ACLTUL_20505 [Blautia faecis]